KVSFRHNESHAWRESLGTRPETASAGKGLLRIGLHVRHGIVETRFGKTSGLMLLAVGVSLSLAASALAAPTSNIIKPKFEQPSFEKGDQDKATKQNAKILKTEIEKPKVTRQGAAKTNPLRPIHDASSWDSIYYKQNPKVLDTFPKTTPLGYRNLRSR